MTLRTPPFAAAPALLLTAGLALHAAAPASAAFLSGVIEEILRQVEERDAFTRPADREAYRRQVTEALSRLQGIRAGVTRRTGARPPG